MPHFDPPDAVSTSAGKPSLLWQWRRNHHHICCASSAFSKVTYRVRNFVLGEPRMSLRPRRSARAGLLGVLVTLGVVCVALSGCTTTQPFEEPNGTTAYQVKCTLWYQCVNEAKKMCPDGYRLVRGPHQRRPKLPNGTLVAGPTRIDFACR
jgi:hypothetical protein